MRRIFTTLAVAALLTGLVAAPAVADEPEGFLESFSFEDVNPCSGDLITSNIDLFVSIHEHDDGFIVRRTRTGTTSDGYIMDHGREMYVGAEMDFSGSSTIRGSTRNSAPRSQLRDGSSCSTTTSSLTTSGWNADPEVYPVDVTPTPIVRIDGGMLPSMRARSYAVTGSILDATA